MSSQEREEAALETWIRRFRNGRRALDDDRRRDLREALRDLRGLARQSLESQRRLVGPLFELHAAGSEATQHTDPDRRTDGHWVVELAIREFQWMRSPELVSWILANVLISRDAYSPAARVAAIELIGADPSPQLLLGLSTCARDEDVAVRRAALTGLAGWQDESVHRLFAAVLAAEGPPSDAPEDLLPSAERLLAERHFASLKLPRTSRALAPVHEWCRARALDPNWRQALAGARAAACLPDELAVPLWIEALESWEARSAAGEPVRRNLHELAELLAARSGRRLGPRSHRWRSWWQAVQEGLVERDAETGELQAPAGTAASFYGLRPATERVVFVIDRSRSMRASARGETTAARNRYHQACEQMLTFLEGLGPNTRFDIILFSDGPERWSRELRQADRRGLSEARAWLSRHNPNGSTNLRSAILEALECDGDGVPDLEALEADTVIVLCDGATDSGPTWVVPFLRATLPVTRIVIHGVQIGRGGDGTLEALARESGGEAIVVD